MSRASATPLARGFHIDLPVRHRIPTHALALLALAGANVIWGGSAAASKAVLPAVPPLTMASARIGIALVVLVVVTRRRDEMVATGRTPMLLGLTGVTLFCACQNLGLLFTDATTTTLIGAAIPVLTIGLAVPMLGERLRGPRLAGLLVSLGGVGIIMSIGAGSFAGVAAISSLLPLASAVSFALYSVLGRRAFTSAGAIGLVAGSTRYGLLFMLPWTLLELRTTSLQRPDIDTVLLLLYLGVGCSALAFVLCGYGLSHLEAGHGAVCGNLKPVVGVVLAIILLGEAVTASQLVGGGLVLIGVGLTMRRIE